MSYHHIRQLPQLAPARAKKKIDSVEDLLPEHGQLAVEQKIDGERFKFHTHVPIPGFLHACTSRRVSEVTGRYVEKTDRVPWLMNAEPLPKQSMIDNEFVSPADAILRELPGWLWDKLVDARHPHMVWLKNKYGGAIPVYPHVGATTSVMGSAPDRARRLQEEQGIITGYAFDLIQYIGRDARQTSQADRRRLLAAILEKVDPEATGLMLMPQWRGLTHRQIADFFLLVTDPGPDGEDGGEGLILKDLARPYDHARNWWKLKRDWPIDVVVTGGYKLGEAGRTGKMLGKVASIEIGVYHEGHLYPIGWVSAIMDSEDNLLTPEEFLRSGVPGRVMEGRCNGKQDDPTAPLGYTLRHPRYRRWRDDKNPTDCTLEALLAELARSRG